MHGELPSVGEVFSYECPHIAENLLLSGQDTCRPRVGWIHLDYSKSSAPRDEDLLTRFAHAKYLIATDGSGDDGISGANGSGITVSEVRDGKPNFTSMLCFKLSDRANSEVAELLALLDSFLLASLLKGPCVIVTDYRRALEALWKFECGTLRNDVGEMKSTHRNRIITEIIKHRSNMQHSIELVWVPAHCKISLNEAADRAAYQGKILQVGDFICQSAPRHFFETIPSRHRRRRIKGLSDGDNRDNLLSLVIDSFCLPLVDLPSEYMPTACRLILAQSACSEAIG